LFIPFPLSIRSTSVLSATRDEMDDGAHQEQGPSPQGPPSPLQDILADTPVQVDVSVLHTVNP